MLDRPYIYIYIFKKKNSPLQALTYHIYSKNSYIEIFFLKGAMDIDKTTH